MIKLEILEIAISDYLKKKLIRLAQNAYTLPAGFSSKRRSRSMLAKKVKWKQVSDYGPIA